MTRRGTHENRYLVEIDGVIAVTASEVTMPGIEHTPVELYVGNQPSPILVRGNFKVEEMTFKHASALNTTGDELFAWIRDFVDGVVLDRRTVRFVVLDEDGATPVDEYELQNCVPTKFKPETHSASGTGASMFTFGLRAEDTAKI